MEAVAAERNCLLYSSRGDSPRLDRQLYRILPVLPRPKHGTIVKAVPTQP
jgi:hypothetical protein